MPYVNVQLIQPGVTPESKERLIAGPAYWFNAMKGVTASILLVNTFLFPGATDRILVIGPFSPTWTGLQAALQARPSRPLHPLGEGVTGGEG